MNFLFKNIAMLTGVSILLGLPVQSNAASYKMIASVAPDTSIFENVHRRGYRHRHRRSNNAGIAAGIIGGLIIGGIIANSARRSANRDHDHVDWCYNRYRSYRARDNTFQPYNGQRRQCRSPYYR
jgi:hypothetical protein